MLFMTNAQLKYTSFGILTIFIKLIQTTPSDVEAFDFFLTPLYDSIYNDIVLLFYALTIFQFFFYHS